MKLREPTSVMQGDRRHRLGTSVGELGWNGCEGQAENRTGSGGRRKLHTEA
jgi:hypothetical protein